MINVASLRDKHVGADMEKLSATGAGVDRFDTERLIAGYSNS